MRIDISRLEDQLLQMSAEGTPGREFCESISELARTGRFTQLREVLPGIVYDELWARYQQDPAAFVAGWRQLAQEMHQGFIQHARQRLTSLTKLQYAGVDGPAETGHRPVMGPGVVFACALVCGRGRPRGPRPLFPGRLL